MVGSGQPVVTRRQSLFWLAAVVLMWIAAITPCTTSPMEYLYSVHMVQHMLLTMFIPPLILMAIPEWLASLVMGNGRVDGLLKVLARPLVRASSSTWSLRSPIGNDRQYFGPQWSISLRGSRGRIHHGDSDVDAYLRADP